jgi:Asp-tRNA(Asn)/Glu-tRNA(Gln) amidotransferase A subunit family amidase
VDRYLAAGLVIFGKTATPEFGAVPSTESHLWGATRNPWNLEHSTGGSSGGSGAAVAAGIVPAAHGNDGGGSIRFPAANCGVFGLKPSRGRVPDAAGVDALVGLSIDHVLSRSVRDSAALLDATHGSVPGDPYVARALDRPYLEDVADRPRGLRVGVQRDPFVEIDIDSDCLEGLDRTAALCESLGHHVEEISPPPIEAAEVYSAMPRLMGIEMGLLISEHEERTGRNLTQADIEPRNWEIVQLGRTLTAIEYEKLRMAVRAVGRRVVQHQSGYDVVLSPTLGMVPPPLGLLGPDASMGVYGQASIRCSVFTIVYNFSGQPAMSVPLHWNDDGLPVGMMFAAAPGGESTLYRLAGQLEEAQPWWGRVPPL